MAITTQPEKKPDGTVTFQITVPKEAVREAYEKAVTFAIAETELSGFRKGKAPREMVIEKVGKQKLYTHALQHLLPTAYADAVKEHNLRPITSPKVEVKNLEEDKDWIMLVAVAEKPQFSLGDYKKVVRDAVASSKIWVPGKGQPIEEPGEPAAPGAKKPESATDEKLSKIFDALLGNTPINLSQLLIEEELTHSLSQLVNQLERLGLTLDQYLVSVGKTADQLREDYRRKAEEEIKLELILTAIGDDLKINVEEAEIDELIKAVGDQKLRERLNAPSDRAILRANLRKRKVVDALLGM